MPYTSVGLLLVIILLITVGSSSFMEASPNTKKIIVILFSASIYKFGFGGPNWILIYLVSVALLASVNSVLKSPILLGTGIVLAVSPLVLGRLQSLITFPWNPFPELPMIGHGLWLGSVSFALLPLGLSFMTLQSVALVAMSKREKFSLIDSLFCLFYFPKITLGPIENPAKFIRRSASLRLASRSELLCCSYVVFSGSMRLLIAKISQGLLDESLGGILSGTSLLLTLTVIGFLRILILYQSIQGATEIAQGLSRAIGIDLSNNFNRPFSAQRVAEFWQRWHMTVTHFFGTYVYRPLCQLGVGRPVATILVFLLFGLFHGAYLDVIVLGLLAGLVVVAENQFSAKPTQIGVILFASIVGALSMPGGIISRIRIDYLFYPSLDAHQLVLLVIASILNFLTIWALGWHHQARHPRLTALSAKIGCYAHYVFTSLFAALAYLASGMNSFHSGYGIL